MAKSGAPGLKQADPPAPKGRRRDQDQHRPAPDVNFWAAFESAPDYALASACCSGVSPGETAQKHGVARLAPRALLNHNSARIRSDRYSP
jgi:hypothetical protein